MTAPRRAKPCYCGSLKTDKTRILLGGWIGFGFFHIGDTMSGITLCRILVAFARNDAVDPHIAHDRR